MKIIKRSHIDEDKWTAWCNQTAASQPFQFLHYLDAVAEKVAFVFNDSETGGMALPYFERMGVKTIYTPVFFRYTDWLGSNPPDPQELSSFVKSKFSEGDLYCMGAQFEEASNDLVYQTLTQKDYHLNVQAKRKLKKIEKEAYSLISHVETTKGHRLITNELRGKFKNLQNKNFESLKKLLLNLSEHQSLRSVGLEHHGELVGVLFLVETNGTILYLKGTCMPEAKLAGGMYALMNSAIHFAIDNNLIFDFGGSRIEGVRQFNKSFGGQDTVYFSAQWSQSKGWYTTLKSLKNKWKKR